jgi:hypothetical protein
MPSHDGRLGELLAEAGAIAEDLRIHHVLGLAKLSMLRYTLHKIERARGASIPRHELLNERAAALLATWGAPASRSNTLMALRKVASDADYTRIDGDDAFELWERADGEPGYVRLRIGATAPGIQDDGLGFDDQVALPREPN